MAHEFFLRTKRINAVIFQLERQIDFTPDGSRGGFTIIAKPFEHPNPRIPCSLQRIFEGRGGASEMQKLIENASKDPLLTQKLTENLRVGEFYEWVDSLVP